MATSAPPPIESKRWSTEVNKVRLTLLIALLFTTLGAGVFRTPSLILMTAMLLGAPFVGIFVSRIGSRHLAVNRRLPASGTVGDIVSGDVAVTNNARWPLCMVHLHSGEVVYNDDKGEIAAIVPIEGEDQVAPVMRGQETKTWRQYWRLQQRGVFAMSPARAGVLDPIGLYNRLPAKTPAQVFTVLPRPIRVSQLSFLDSATAGKQIPQHATAVADATDFHGVRPWRPGEGLRRIHWKSTARTGQLHIVEWEEALASDTSVILDNQLSSIAGQGMESTLEVGITLAASVATYLLENGYQCDLFYWEQPAPEKPRGIVLRQKLLQPGASNAEAPVMHHYRGGLSSQAGAALTALAQVQAVRSSAATLPHLCELAAPALPPGRSILLLASSLADVDGALHRIHSTISSGVVCQAMVFDAESFEAANEPHKVTPLGRLPVSSRQIRLVRYGEPLAAVLERQW